MDLDALGACLTTAACVVTQTTSGLIVGMLLFLVAAGVTLIFGVLKIVNFAHGTFYMLGGYIAYTALGATDSYALAVLSGALAMALFGVVFERALISRVYGSNVLMQLLVCYAVDFGFFFLVATTLNSAARNALEYSIQGTSSPAQAAEPSAAVVSNLAIASIDLSGASTSNVSIQVCSSAVGVNSSNNTTQCTTPSSGAGAASD